MINVTRYPFLFWFLKEEPLATLSDEHTVKKEEKIYRIEKENKGVFLFCKYLPIFLLLSLILNFNDIPTNKQKLLEHLSALMICFYFLFAMKSKWLSHHVAKIAYFALLFIGVIIVNMFINSAFIFKYVAIYITAVYLFFDTRQSVYKIFDEQLFKGHLLIKKERIW